MEENVIPTNIKEPITLLSIVKMLIKIVPLGFLYFFITGMSVMSTDSCGIGSKDCKYLSVGLSIGALWMLFSFILNLLSIIKNKRISSLFPLSIIFSPYIAVPVFIIILLSFGSIDGYLYNKNIQKQVGLIPISKQIESVNGLVNWVKYTDLGYAYSVDYPVKLENFKGLWTYKKFDTKNLEKINYISMVTFGPSDYNDSKEVWRVTVIDKNNEGTIIKSIDELIKKESDGCKWMKCEENRKEIIINGVRALFVSNPVEKEKTFNTRVYIENNNYIYIMSGHTSGTLLPEFETFYNSFSFSN